MLSTPRLRCFAFFFLLCRLHTSFNLNYLTVSHLLPFPAAWEILLHNNNDDDDDDDNYIQRAECFDDYPSNPFVSSAISDAFCLTT